MCADMRDICLLEGAAHSAFWGRQEGKHVDFWEIRKSLGALLCPLFLPILGTNLHVCL